MIRRPPRSTRLTHSFPSRRSSDLSRWRCGTVAGKAGNAQSGLIVAGIDHAVFDFDRKRPHRAVCRCAQCITGTYVKTGTVQDAGDLVAVQFAAAEFKILMAAPLFQRVRSEEHTSELQSLMRISYAVIC